MESAQHTIQQFLHHVRKRLRARAAWMGFLYLLAGLGLAFLLAPLLAQWLSLGRGLFFFVITVSGLGALGAYALAVHVPARRWRPEAAPARFVGDQVSELRSDLLSSVEFMETVDQPNDSRALREALVCFTARRVEPMRPQALVPFSPVRKAFGAAFASIAAVLLVFVVSPASLSMGWARLLASTPDAPFGGADLVDEPVVGDVDIVVKFPAYTQRQNLTLPASSGDFEAMPGSTIEIGTKSVGVVQGAQILLADTAELESDEEIRMERVGSVAAAGDELRASFEVKRETYYRFAVDESSGRRVESRARHITIRDDRGPQVELYAPADELDVAKLKRVELAYQASDDFGLAKVELVYEAVGGGGARQAIEFPMQGKAPRSAQASFLWDLSEVPLRPGVEISYHLEVTDNDNVLGPNVGKSRSYKLRLFSPRERHEDLISRQQALAEHMLDVLADRLTVEPAQLAPHRAVHRKAEQIVIEIGSLVAALKDDELASDALRDTLKALRARVSKRLKDEEQLLSALEKKGAARELNDTEQRRVGDLTLSAISELEDDVLRLADWLDRQRLENVLALSDEVKASQERLDKLFEEFERSGSQEALSEIERELSALERRLEEMDRQSAAMAEDVLDRFVNSEALEAQAEQQDCLGKVRSLLTIGEVEEAKKQLEQCREQMDESAKAQEESLQALRSDSFSEEEKRFNEALSDLADLNQDQKDIARKTEQVYRRYADEVAKLRKDKGGEASEKAAQTLGKLKKRINQIPLAGLTPFAKEELELAKKYLDDADKMLDKGELAEALSMARHVQRSLRTLQSEMEYALDEDWSRKAVLAEKAARQSLPLARRLVEELEDATPSPEEIMSSEDRRQLDKLRKQQRSVRKRGQKLSKRLQSQQGKLPGESAQMMQEGLAEAMEHMERAEEQMKKTDPSSARHEAAEAADRLGRVRKDAQGAARQKLQRRQTNWRDEPIRIPGSEDYKAPEKYREEILDAMQDEGAPEAFADQIKRYYKDIIQ